MFEPQAAGEFLPYRGGYLRLVIWDNETYICAYNKDKEMHDGGWLVHIKTDGTIARCAGVYCERMVEVDEEQEDKIKRAN